MATKTETTFRTAYAVTLPIDAPPDAVWALLTDADRFPRWCSTVTRLRGPIAPGTKLALEVKAAPGRTFTPTVTGFDPPRSMVWSDGVAPMFRGVRRFTLTPLGPHRTEFVMEEVFSGLMLPLIRPSLPDFRAAFDAFAADLARASTPTAS